MKANREAIIISIQWKKSLGPGKRGVVLFLSPGSIKQAFLTSSLDAIHTASRYGCLFHNTKGKENGITLLAINTNSQPKTINLPSEAVQYTLTSDQLEGTVVFLNGEGLKLGNNDELPELKGNPTEAGDISLSARSISFFTLDKWQMGCIRILPGKSD